MGCGVSNAALPRFAADSVIPTTPADFYDDYGLGGKLGRGTFAVKVLDLRHKEQPNLTSKTLKKRACAEATIWTTAMDHKNVLRLLNYFYKEAFCYFVMEQVGSLMEHMVGLSELNERSVGNILEQMFSSLSHVHSVQVVHRDVKPGSFFMGGQHGMTVKLSDFGSSAILPKSGKVEGIYGTAPFMCPEMLKKEFYDETADVWSMAVLAYCFFFGDFPYVVGVMDSKFIKQAVLYGKPPSFKPVAPCHEQVRSNSVVEFVQKLLVRKPNLRPSASDALKMPFMLAVQNPNMQQNEVDLPSLRHMIYAAEKAGAFEVHNPTKQVLIDTALAKEHKKGKIKHGSPLLDQIFDTRALESCNSQLTEGWEAAQSDHSFDSNGCDSSWRTTATGNASFQCLSSNSAWSQLNSVPECSDVLQLVHA